MDNAYRAKASARAQLSEPTVADLYSGAYGVESDAMLANAMAILRSTAGSPVSYTDDEMPIFAYYGTPSWPRTRRNSRSDDSPGASRSVTLQLPDDLHKLVEEQLRAMRNE